MERFEINIKWSITFLLILGIGSCYNVSTNESNNYRCLDQSLDGIWGLVQYFDSIEINKKIAKYRIQEPTWFNVILKIEGDSGRAFGSIYNSRFNLNQCLDTVSIINDFPGEEEDDWPLYKLYRKEDFIAIKRIPRGNYNDTTEYLFKRKNDLNLEDYPARSNYQFDTLVANFFTQKLFSGKYSNFKGDTVIVHKNCKVNGLRNFDSIVVNNYFGTFHPFKNEDALTFISNKNEYPFNWKFTNDTLILREFVRDESGDFFEITENEIVLKKIE